MEKKKICIIAQFPPPIHGLSKAVDTIYNSNQLKDEFDLSKINITNNKIFLINLIRILFKKVDLFYLTISQSRYGNLRDLLIMKLIKMKRAKCIIHLHGGYYRTLVEHDIPNWQKKINFKLVRKLDGVIVLGQSLKKIFEGMIESNKIYTIPNCVDNDYLISDNEFNKKIINISTKKIFHVLYLSNLIRSKGYIDVLEMAKVEKERVESGGERFFHFDFAGGFFEKAEECFFQKFIKENDLENYITYHGIVKGGKKLELLRQSDIFILLTKYPNEGQPISILEAMGNGMIIVTTNHAGIPDIVKENNGLILNKDKYSIKKIYNELTRILKDNKKTIKIINNNRDEMMKSYTQDIYIKNIAECFKKFIN